MEKLLFLGTSGDHIVTGKQILGSGGIIFQTEGMQFLIDPGPGCLIKAKENGIHMRENTAIVVTHNHLNHMNDLRAVISATTHNGLDRQCVLICPKSVYDDVEEHFRNCFERVIVVDAGKKVGINKIEIQSFKAEHTEDSLGYKFICPTYKIAFSGDTSYYECISNNFSDCDILVLNVTHLEKTEGHLCANDALEIIKEAKPNLGIITHFGSKMLSANPINIAREIEKQSSINVIAAKDGMSLNPMIFSKEMKQRTLGSY